MFKPVLQNSEQYINKMKNKFGNLAKNTYLCIKKEQEI